MAQLTFFMQLFVTFLICVYFISQIKQNANNDKEIRSEYVSEAEELNKLRRIRLNEPMCEIARPSSLNEIIGQDDGIRALRSALWGKYPQHIIIYGPPGVGKTAAARIILEEVKRSPESPFSKNAPFVEVDATIMRCDEFGFTDPLIGSVHDPIYQGSGMFGQNGLPQPKPGAVTRAHGGILFIDEIGELSTMQINRLLKVLEDSRVFFESAYYLPENKNIPTHIHKIFKEGYPADFRLIGATTRSPKEIPDAIRSRCTEIYFNPLSRDNICHIVKNAVLKSGFSMEEGGEDIISVYAKNGRDAVGIVEMCINLIEIEKRNIITKDDIKWVFKSQKYFPLHIRNTPKNKVI